MSVRYLVFLCLVSFISFSVEAQNKSHKFELGKDDFSLDGKPYQIISGEIHPARVPVEYWQHRIKMAKAMGCNTIAAYIFWNYHEIGPGVFDFQTGNRDIEKFIQLVQDEGMWLILRPGPYVCAEWDFGGIPSYLLKIPDIKVRCMDQRYTEAAERYIKNLSMEVEKYQVTQGGPIIMVQVENEYGSYGNDRTYMKWVQEKWEENGIDVAFFTADGAAQPNLEAGTLPGVAIGLDPGANENNFKQASLINADVPSFCSELYPGWLTHWGEDWQRPDVDNLLKDVKWLMDNEKSFNFYVIHGGTNFGYWAGANAFSPDEYLADVTSYDYDAPINEMGQPTAKYYALRNLLKEYKLPGEKFIDIPESLPVIEIPKIEIKDYASIWDNLPEAKVLPQPKPMEMFDQQGGFILYRTKLVGQKSGKLRVTDLHDYATVFLDGKYIGTLDRSKNINTIEIPKSETVNPVLDILVEGMGRINFAEYMIDRKGITDRVSLNGMTLMEWQIFNLPLDENYLSGLKPGVDKQNRPGKFFRAEFALEETGDTYLDLTEWKKGIVWVNGHNLGRYWEIGPQERLFCPSVFLNKGKNEIVVFDLHKTSKGYIQGMNTLEEQ